MVSGVPSWDIWQGRGGPLHNVSEVALNPTLALRAERLRFVLRLIGVGVAYYVAARIGLSFALVGDNVTPMWPPTGVAVAALFTLGYRVWPGIALAAFAVNLPISPEPSALTSVAIAAGNTIAPVVAVLLLRALSFDERLERLRDVVVIVIAALVSMLISAAGGTYSIYLAGEVDASRFAEALGVWWTGDATGVLLVAPLLWQLRRAKSVRIEPRRALEAAILGIGLTAVTVAVLRAADPLIFLAFPVLGIVAWRFRQAGAAPAVLTVSLLAVYAAFHEWGPFAGMSLLTKMLVLQSFNAAAAFSGFFLAAALSERMKSRRALEDQAVALEDMVRDRTAELSEANKQLRTEVGERLEAEYQLQQREEAFRTVFDSAAIGMAQCDPEGRFLRVNVALQRLIGYSIDDLSGRSFLEITHTDDVPRTLDLFERLLLGMLSSFDIESRLIRPDGSWVWAHTSISLVRDGDGAARYVHLLVQDVTARRRAEALQRADAERARLQRLFSAVPAIVLVTSGPNHVIELVNNAFLNLAGRRDYAGQPLREVVPEMALQGHAAIMDHVYETGESYSAGEALLRFDGPDEPEERYFSIVYQPIPGDDGSVEGILAHAVDVTETIRGRQHVIESLAFLDTLLRTAPAGFAVFDQHLRYVRINDRLASVNGLPADAHLGRTMREIAPDLADAHDDAIRRVLETGAPVIDIEIAATVTHATMTRHWLASYYPVQTPDGDVLGVGMVVVEITERKLAERLLSGQNEVLELLARGAAQVDVLASVCALAEEQSMGETRAAIWLTDPDGNRLTLGAAPSLPPTFVRMLDGVAIGPMSASCGSAAHLKQPIETGDISTDPRWSSLRDMAAAHGLRSAWSWPILSADLIVLGVVDLYATVPRLPSALERQLIERLATTSAIAIERGRAERERQRLLEREREVQALLYQREHRVAETLQRSLLPERLPDIPGIEIAARYIPASADVEVGGDWYDVIPMSDGRISVAIGDIAGHGITAAAAMGQMRMALRAYAIEGLSPGDALGRLNRLLIELQPGAMSTVLYGQLDLFNGELVFSSAGHPPPLLIPPDGSDPPAYQEEGLSPPLGITTMMEFPETTLTLPSGATLLLYTDGLVEKRGEQIDDGLTRLMDAAAAAPQGIEAASDHIVAAMIGSGVSDDVALLAVRPVSFAGRRLTLTRPALASTVPEVRRIVRRWLLQNGADDDECFDMLIAFAEAYTNAVQHAYGHADGWVQIDADLEEGELAMIVRDHGAWKAPVVPPSSNDGLRPSGRGFMIIRELMESVDVISTVDGTEVRMRRRLEAASP